MAFEVVSCPYCNAHFPLPDPVVPGPPLFCPRCGERVPERALAARTSVDPVPAGEPWNAGEQPPPGPRAQIPRVSNRTIAGFILLTMFVVAVLALDFALETQGIRREHDIRLPKAQQRLSVPFLISMAGKVWILGLALIMLKGRLRRESAALPPAQASPSSIEAEFTPPPRKGGLVRAALIAVVVLAVVGLGLDIRKAAVSGSAQQSGQPFTSPGTTPVRSVAPADLEGLAFLPPDTNVIAAVQVAAALAEPTGKELLSHLHVGSAAFDPDAIARWTGLEPQDIDHVVAGLNVGDRLVPRWIVVVRANRPIDPARVKAAMKERGPAEAFRLATSQTLIVADSAKDLDAVPQAPDSGLRRLSEPLRTFLQERIDRTAQAWAVGHSDHWDRTSAALWFDRFLHEDEHKLLAEVRTLGVWLQVDGGVTLNAAADCAGEAGARDLDRFLDRWQKEGAKHFRKDAWVTLQARLSPQAVRRALEKPTHRPDRDTNP